MWGPVIKNIDITGRSLVGLMLGVAVFLVFTEAVSRTLFSFSVFWVQEVVIYLIIWSVFIGAALAIRKGEHLKVTFLVEKLPPKIQFYISLGTTLIGLVFSLALFISGIQLVSDAYFSGVVSISTLEVPLWIPYLILPGTAFLFILSFIERFVNLCRERGE